MLLSTLYIGIRNVTDPLKKRETPNRQPRTELPVWRCMEILERMTILLLRVLFKQTQNHSAHNTAHCQGCYIQHGVVDYGEHEDAAVGRAQGTTE